MEYVKSTELYHHGVLGQKWGHRNGPPYPLHPDRHSAAEKKAGWQKSVKGGDGDVKKKNSQATIDRHGRIQDEVASGKTGYISRSTLEKAENSSRKRLNNDATNYKAKRSEAEDAKKANKQEQTKESKAALRAAKQQQKEAEKKLKQDLKAEQGRELYAQGNTVEKYSKQQRAATAVSVGLDIVTSVLAENGNQSAAVAVGVANNVAWGAYLANRELQKNKLRAYYAQNG